MGLRRTSLVAGMVLGVAVLSPGPASGSGSTHVAVGRGHTVAAGRDYTHFAFAAQDGPEGMSGHITLQWPPAHGQTPSGRGILVADVTCLVVEGNAATIIGNVTMSENIDGPSNPDWVVVWAIDDPSLGDTDINSFGYGELACEFLPQGVLPILSGDIVVR
jgi:hypothetical protein